MAIDPKVIRAARKKKVSPGTISDAQLEYNKSGKPVTEASTQPYSSQDRLSSGLSLGGPAPINSEDVAANTAASTRTSTWKSPEEKKRERLIKLAKTGAHDEKRDIGSESVNQMAQSLPQAYDMAQALGLTDLGRLDTESSAAAKETLGNASELAKGYNSTEMAAMKSQALEATANTSQAAERRLKAMQASQGMKGGAAASQQMGLMQQGIQARANIERDLMIGQFQAKLQGNQQLSSVQQNQDAVKREAEQFNLTQASREKMMPLQIATGAQAADVMKEVGVMNANATMAAGQGGSGTLFCTMVYLSGKMGGDLYAYDMSFAQTVGKDVLKGYESLITPFIHMVTPQSIMMTIVTFFVLSWVTHIAHIQNPTKYKESFVGKCLKIIGVPLCKFTGMILTKLGK